MRKLVLALIIFVFLFALPGYGLSQDAGNDVKTGLAVITSIAGSVDAGGEDGLAQANSVIVAVTVDKDNKITNCAIDTAQTKINFSGAGKIITPLDKVFVGKQELEKDYGMIKASKIGKEWYEQADAFAKYVVGKTADEVKGISLDEEGRPAVSELTSSVTIHITDYIAGIEKAVANADEIGAKVSDKLGIGVITTINKSKDATAKEEGLAQAYSNIATVTFDSEGIITSCVINAVQVNIQFNQKGAVTSDLSGTPKTKNELGDEYGLKSASKIGKEWYEQADAFAKYVVGKTVDEVKGISLDEEGRPAVLELTSSVTIHIGPFITIIEKAYHAAN